MEEALSCIGRMPIFSGIAEEELYTLIKCCDGQMAVFEKDQWIFQAGEELGDIMDVWRSSRKISGMSKKKQPISCREKYSVKAMPAQAIDHCMSALRQQKTVKSCF